LALDFALGLNGSMAKTLGKDPTLTDRTKIWAFLLSMHTNPVIGVGYQSFWLGPRLEEFWQNSGLGRINEAHNGYLEVYLELGIVGVMLVGWFLISSYRGIWRRARSSEGFAVLGLALWLALVFYDMSEAGFENGLLWVVFLMGAIALHKPLKGALGNRTLDRAHSDY
jgi:O-antigen ligase